eukprot:scaffold6155_cov108-Cylindrotheca_fusiformis.AAC.3
MVQNARRLCNYGNAEPAAPAHKSDVRSQRTRHLKYGKSAAFLVPSVLTPTSRRQHQQQH